MVCRTGRLVLDDLPGEHVVAAHRAQPRAHRAPHPDGLGRGELLAVHALVPARPVTGVRHEREDLIGRTGYLDRDCFREHLLRISDRRSARRRPPAEQRSPPPFAGRPAGTRPRRARPRSPRAAPPGSTLPRIASAADPGPGSTASPAPTAATRRAFTGWSAKSGTTTRGSPAARAPSVVPEPPWQTTASAEAKTRAWGTQRSMRTLGGAGPRAFTSVSFPTVKRMRAGSPAAASSTDPEDHAGDRQPAGHASERDVDQRAVVARPPVGQRLRRSVVAGGSKAMHPGRVRRLGILERLREEAQVDRVPHALGHSRRAVVKNRLGDRKRLSLGCRQPDRDPSVGDAVRLGREGRRELGRIAEHEIGPPLGARLVQVGQHRPHVQPGKDLGDDNGLRLLRRGRRHPCPGGTELLLRRSLARPEPVAGALHRLGQRGQYRDHHLVSAPDSSVDERNQRVEMAGPTGGGEQNTHARSGPHLRLDLRRPPVANRPNVPERRAERHVAPAAAGHYLAAHRQLLGGELFELFRPDSGTRRSPPRDPARKVAKSSTPRRVRSPTSGEIWA